MTRKEWTKDEVEYLKDNYLELDYKDIGEKFNRSFNSINRKAQKLGLSKGRKKSEKYKEMMRKRNYEYVKIGKVRFFSKEYNPMNDKKSRDKMTKTVQDAWDSGRFKVNSGCWKKGNKPWNGELKGKGIMKSHTEGKTKDNYAPLKIVSLKLKEYSKTRTPIIKDTTIEVKIQNFLKQLNIEYFTHQYVNIKHGYQCDILIPSMNMVIECDGNYWHKYPIGTEIDHIRTKELLEKGFKVLRLWEFEIRKMDINEFKQLLPNKIEGRA